MKIPSWPSFKGYRNIDLGLSRVYDLLERLDNPQHKLPPTIHIAGTNGKGSTLSFLYAIFKEAGYLVHRYTSPHLVHFNERIVLANAEIDDVFLEECLQNCKKAAEQEPKIEVTFFEGITVAAFLAFSKVRADVLLLETGMGGRLDATNILPQVLCSIITPIAFDHMDFLGDSLDKIAFEKAGIIKQNCPVMIAKQDDAALETICHQAKSHGAETKIFNQDWKVEKHTDGFSFKGCGANIQLPMPSMLGDHQIDNAALAIATILNQNTFTISHENITSALTKAYWPARLQRIMQGKYVDMLPPNYALFLDGSHNIQAAVTIKEFLRQQRGKTIYVIFAMLQDKDCEGFLKEIAQDIDQLICIDIPNEDKCYKKEEIVTIANKLGIESNTAYDLNDSFDKAMINKDEESLILICGSLYLAGSFLENNI